VCKEKCHNIKTEGQIVVQLLPSSWSIVAWQAFISPESKEGHKYAMVFVDDYSGASGVYFLKNKSDATRATEQFLAGKVKRLRSDNGGEYINEEFRSLMLKNQIKHKQSARHSPHQNGTAERTWRSLFDMARCLLIGAELP